MRVQSFKTVASVAFLAAFAAPSASRASVFFDDFTGGSLDPAWAITTTNVTDYKYSVASSKLTMSDNDPAAIPDGTFNSAINPSTNNSYGDVYFTRPLAAPANDFVLDFDFSWDNNVQTPNTLTAMPLLYLRLLDASNNVVIMAGMSDFWNGDTAARHANIGGVNTFGQHSNLPGVSTGTTINISRVGSNVNITWAGGGATGGLGPNVFPVSGTTSTAITQVQLQFSRFRLDAGSPQATMGEVNVDRIQMVPEPASLGLLALGAAMVLRRRQSHA